jgi:hypothetical protein
MFDPEASLNLDALRARLRAMNDQMLLRWGEAAARLCRPEANLGVPPREVFVVHLREARAEWRRRHPKVSAVEE